MSDANSTLPDSAAALFGGLDLSAMLGAMGVELPDEDSTDLDDVADALADLTARVDWLAAALLAALDAAPGKFRPTLPAYPPPVIED